MLYFSHGFYAELKTEEGYSADIVRTYIPGDICPHNVGTMSACRHNVRTMSAQCPHNVGTMSALCPHNISRRIYVSRGRCFADIVWTLSALLWLLSVPPKRNRQGQREAVGGRERGSCRCQKCSTKRTVE